MNHTPAGRGITSPLTAGHDTMTREEIEKMVRDLLAAGQKEAAAAFENRLKQLEASQSEALKPLADLGTRLAAIEEAVTNPDPKKGEPDPKKADPNATGGDEIPAWAKDIIATIGEYKKRDETAATTAKITSTVDAFLKSKHPNLKGKQLERARARLVSASPADESAVAQAMSAYREELADMGVDTKPFTAEPVKEGATAASNLSEEEQRIQAIRSRGPVSKL
jgi:hypothetical protein